MQTRKTTTEATAGGGVEEKAAHKLEMHITPTHQVIGNADIREVQSPADEAERLASGLPNTLSYSKAVSR